MIRLVDLVTLMAGTLPSSVRLPSMISLQTSEATNTAKFTTRDLEGTRTPRLFSYRDADRLIGVVENGAKDDRIRGQSLSLSRIKLTHR
jgi:hypothetical protein